MVPEPLWGHPSVVNSAKLRGKKPSRILLDSSLHHSAMKVLPENERRGRPDLAHFFLITALESILNKKGKLRVYIHTRNNELIKMAPDLRIMRSYLRFTGLVEQLFAEGRVPQPPEKPLMEMQSGRDLKSIVAEAKPDAVIALSPEGTPVKLAQYFQKFPENKNVVCIIGGFPHGDFKSPAYALATEKISICDEVLTGWTVASELIVNYENAIGL
jgi:rRNA small subunit pseudouridine methyltransferase Nep1